MKAILFLLLCGMTFCLPFNFNRYPVETEAPEPVAPAGEVDTISFSAQIRPILERRCNPCHFPGGKMYQAMPFDRGETVVGHLDGMLKRIKDEKESGLLKQYCAEWMARR